MALTQQTQRTGKSISEIFNNFSKDAIQRFPNLKGRLIVLEMNEGKVYASGVDGESAKHYLQSQRDERGQSLLSKLDRNPDQGTASYFDPYNRVTVILSNERVDESEPNNLSKQSEEHLLFVLDHELGHWAITDGHYGGDGNDYGTMVGESVADAYALIRHYQRFGTDETHDKYVDPAARALDMILGGSFGHFTSFVLDEITKQKDKIDFASLDPVQTAELAHRFALKYMPSAPVVEDMFRAFEPLRHARSTGEAVQTLIDLTLSPNTDGFTFKLGSTLLKDIMKNKKTLSKLNVSQQTLATLSQKLKEKEFKLEQEGVLFNLPAAQKKPAAPANQNRSFRNW